MDRKAVHAMPPEIHDRRQARKELVIANVAPKLVGVEDVAEADEIRSSPRRGCAADHRCGRRGQDKLFRGMKFAG